MMAYRAPDRYTADELEAALEAVGQLLMDRDKSYEVVVIGGANLLLTGVISRPTVDVDVVALRVGSTNPFECSKPLPPDLEQAVSEVASIAGLPPRWMNGAASSDLANGLPLPSGFETRLALREYGGLTVAFAHRQDIVAWKLQAAVDRSGTDDKHLDDLKLLGPTAAEVASAREWFEQVEVETSGFWVNLDAVLEALDVE